MEHFLSPNSDGDLRSDPHQSQNIGGDADQNWAFKKHIVKRNCKFRNQNFFSLKRKRKFRNQKLKIVQRNYELIA